ncbi:hypothetical protein [Lentilactobacillus fungorum]|uniref:hypothetical protein n=1 Tax=Lentilactobacillus fungorum TaxID=2201250 RepID=UPI001E4F18A2|nr:hypothetical protein [Lentilactobacillus fungorum]
MSQPQLAKLERLDSIPSLHTLQRYAHLITCSMLSFVIVVVVIKSGSYTEVDMDYLVRLARCVYTL